MKNFFSLYPAFFKKTKEKTVAIAKRFFAWANAKPLRRNLLLAFFLELTVETLSRHSLFSAFGFLFAHFVFFVFGFAVILSTLLLAELFPKARFVRTVVSLFWFLMGLTDFIIRFLRTTPFEASDFLIIGTGIGIVKVYLSLFEIILLALFLLALLAGLVVLAVKAKKQKVDLKRAPLRAACSIALTALLTVSLLLLGAAPRGFTNLVDAYREYGFVYCFSCSIFDRGVDRPEDYSPETVKEAMKNLAPEASPAAENQPNIIAVQLESFFDVKGVKGLTFESDPIPTFTYLKEHFTSGYLSVPSIGAGTANTEFEVLTGIAVSLFGTGEYPYKTILKDSSCESFAYDLKALGYTATAIHDNVGAFYDRHTVFSKLGFDTFQCLEYMTGYEENPLGWVKDECLTEEILTALQNTEGRDFIEAISVQGHGRYPSEDLEGAETIGVLGAGDMKAAYEYYAGQLREMDAFIAALLAKLQTCGEKTVVILYGDHLPSLNLSSEDLAWGNELQTEYVIWSNYGLEKCDRDLASYQLLSYALSLVGISQGPICRLHQQYLTVGGTAETYLQNLHTLAYDILYGENYWSEEETPFPATEMKMGLSPVTADSYAYEDGVLTVHGSGFTPYSRIYIGERKVQTVFLSDTVLTAKIPLRDLEDGAELSVGFVSYDWILLGKTDALIWEEPEKE